MSYTTEPIGTCEDFFGEEIEFSIVTAVDDEDDDIVGAISIDVAGGGGIVLHAEQREQFQRLFMEAERRAEAHAAPAVSETEVPGGH